MQFCIREEDQYKTSFRVPGSQYEFRVGAFGLHGMSSVLMRFMYSIFGCPELSFDSTGRALPAARTPGTGPPMLGRFVQVYCDDILIFSKTREKHPVHVSRRSGITSSTPLIFSKTRVKHPVHVSRR